VTDVVAETEEDEQSPVAPRAGRRRSAATKPPRKPVPIKVQNVLWGRAAGRCQYAGCNKLLIGEQISGARNANKSYIAHIVGDSPDGPRGDAILSPKLAHDPDNLMLVCDEHHRVISTLWQRSNPRGYLKWFLARMAAVYEKRRKDLLQKGVRAGTEPIPDYRIRTPLQQAIMILKRGPTGVKPITTQPTSEDIRHHRCRNDRSRMCRPCR
jgi:hypothetical protein